MIISLVSPCATVGAYKLMQGQETFYGTVKHLSIPRFSSPTPQPSKRAERKEQIGSPIAAYLHTERFPAATLIGSIGVINLKPCPHQPIVEVQFGPREVECTLHIHKNPDPPDLNRIVILTGRFFKIQLIL